MSSGYTYSESNYTEDHSEISSRVSSQKEQYFRLRGTLSKRSDKDRDSSVRQYIVPKNNTNDNTKNVNQSNSSNDWNKSKKEKARPIILRPAKFESKDRYYTHGGNYDYHELETFDNKVPTDDNKRSMSRYDYTDLGRSSGVQIVDGKCGSCYSTSIAESSKFGKEVDDEDDSENDDDYDDDDDDDDDETSDTSKDDTEVRKKSEHLSVSFNEDIETPKIKTNYQTVKPPHLQMKLNTSGKGTEMFNTQRMNADTPERKSRKKKTGITLPDNPYAVTVDAQRFQMSIPRTPSPPPATVTPKLKTKTVRCVYEEPPIEKYKTAIIDTGERIKEEPPEDIVVIQNDPPETEEILSSPIGESVLIYHIPPSPEPEPVIEPIPPPPPPPYKPPKIKNNPVVTRVGGGWMQIDHHRRNHIPLTVYNRQRYNGNDSFLYIKSKYTTNRNVPPITYKNKNNLLEKLQRETAVVISD